MTPEQLSALMNWAITSAEFRIEMNGDADMDGSYHKAEKIAKLALYDAFGFTVGPTGDPVQKST